MSLQHLVWIYKSDLQSTRNCITADIFFSFWGRKLLQHVSQLEILRTLAWTNLLVQKRGILLGGWLAYEKQSNRWNVFEERLKWVVWWEKRENGKSREMLCTRMCVLVSWRETTQGCGWISQENPPLSYPFRKGCSLFLAAGAGKTRRCMTKKALLILTERDSGSPRELSN